jgi:hypothetical protein
LLTYDEGIQFNGINDESGLGTIMDNRTFAADNKITKTLLNMSSSLYIYISNSYV